MKYDQLKAMLGKDMIGTLGNIFLGGVNLKFLLNDVIRISQDTKELYKIFDMCLKNLSSKNLEPTEFIIMIKNLLNRFDSSEYNELLTNINSNASNIDIEVLIKILDQPNYFNIDNESDIINYEEIKRNVCDKIIEGNSQEISKYPSIAKLSDIDRLKFAVLEKLMGYDLEQAEDIDKKYQHIEEITAEDEYDIKAWIYSIKRILNIEDPLVLKRLYDLEPVPTQAQQKLILERESKKIYMREYNKTLFNLENANELSNEQIIDFMPKGTQTENYKFIDAGIDFNMIITAFNIYSAEDTLNYEESWNNRVNFSKIFSSSLIGNDMIDIINSETVCYGFTRMEDNSLKLAGKCDLGSESIDEIYDAAEQTCYTTPQDLKEETGLGVFDGYTHNELVFSKVQNGKIKQPDYLVVFKRNNQIPMMKETLKAVDDFKKKGINLPIVIVDVDRCIESEKSKLNAMLQELEKNRSKELAIEIERKLNANMHTDRLIFGKWRDEYMIKKSKIFNYDLIDDAVSLLGVGEDEENRISNVINEVTYRLAYEQTGIEERQIEVSKIIAIQRAIIIENQNNGKDFSIE